MELQKTYTRAYAEQLQREVEQNLERYSFSEFGTDETKELVIPNLPHPEGLLDEMMAAKSDLEAGKALYNAYSTLTPLQASQNAFWIYLAHTELFPYVQKRWPDLKTANNKRNYALTHWFFHNGLIGNALSGLWWSVYCSVDNDSNEIYKYTDFLFSNYTLRVIRLGSVKLFRHKEAVFGIIKYLMDTKNSSSTNSMEDRVNFVVSYFNRMGATKQLSYLDRDFFYNELNKVHGDLMHYHRNKTDEDNEFI